MARKIKINKLPAGYHMMPDGTIMRDSDHKMMTGGNVLRDVSETKDFNLEAEGGETIVTDKTGDGLPEHYAIEGKRHSQGGVKMKESAGSFIFSDTPKMKIGKELNSFFNKSESKSYTPAEIAKQYIDMNDDKRALMDKNSDKLEQSTAALNMFNKTYKLGGLAMAQEAKKNFPDGIPQIASLYAQLNGIATSDSVMPGGMQQAKYGAQVKMYQEGEQVDNETLPEATVVAEKLPLQFRKGERVYINDQPYMSSRVAGKWNPFKENYNIYTNEAGNGEVYIPSDTYLNQGIANAAIGKPGKQMNWRGVTPVDERAMMSDNPFASKKYYQYQPVSFSRMQGVQNEVPSAYSLGTYNNQFGETQNFNLAPNTSFIYEAPGVFSEAQQYSVVNPFISRDQELSGGFQVKVKNEEGRETYLPAEALQQAFAQGMIGLPAGDGSFYYPQANENYTVPAKSGKSKDKKSGVQSLQDLNNQLSAPQDTVWGESFKYGGPKYEKGGPITPFTVNGVTRYRYNGVDYDTREAAIAQRTKDQGTASSTTRSAGSTSTPTPRKQEIKAIDKEALEVLTRYGANPTLPEGWASDPNTSLYANTQAFNPSSGAYEGAAARLPQFYQYWKDRGADVSGLYDASGNVRQLKAEDEAFGNLQDYITQYNQPRIDAFIADRQAKGQTLSPEEINLLKRRYTFAAPGTTGVHRSELRDAKAGERSVNMGAFEYTDVPPPKTPPATPPKTPPVPPLEPPTEIPPAEPPYTPPFPQDEIAVASAFANNAFINKYPSWTPQVQLPRVRPTFLDPRYANAAAQSSAQMAMDASNVFAGNESVARAMNAMTQGQSADKQIGNISNIGMQNVGIANQMAGASAEMAAREQMINTQLQKTGYDQNVLAADNYDKERSMNMLQNTLPAVQNLMTNWALAKSFPYMTPNYRVDTRGYGTIVPNPGAAKTKLTPGSAGSAVPTFAEYRNRFPDVTADKVAEMYSKQYISGNSQTPGVDASTMDPRMMMMYMQMMRNQGR
jgi:hypothetical protein